MIPISYAYSAKLFVAMIMLPLLVYAVPPSNFSLVKNATFQIPANIPFSETVYVERGQYVIIDAKGKWRYDPRPQFETGPDGLVNVFTTFKPGMLQGRFGDGEVFPVGSHWEGYATNRGRLALGMYEPKATTYTSYQNNVGNLTVNIKVYAPLPLSKKNNDTHPNISDEKQQLYSYNYTNKSVENLPISEQKCIVGIILFIAALISLAILQKYDMR